MRSVLILSGLLPLVFLHAQNNLSDTLEIEEVVVTGTRVEVARQHVPLSLSLVSRSELEQSTESALLPLLSEQIPGLFVTERGITGFGVAEGAAGQINIRGLGGSPTTQVLILIDGHPQFMGMMGHHLPDAYVTSDAERVEVIRGPASFLYGSNAMGGAINIITRKQKTEGAEARVGVQYGSFNTQKYTGSFGFRKKKLEIFSSFNHDRTDGHRDSADFQISNGYVKASYQITPSLRLMTDLSLAAYETSDPGMSGGPAGERIDILRGKTSLSLENSLERLEGAVKAYYNFGEHEISDGWHSLDEMKGVMIYQGYRGWQGGTVTLGFDHMVYGGKGSPIFTVLRDEEGTVIMPPAFTLSESNDRWIDQKNTALYSSIQQILREELTLSGGLRYEISNSYGNEWIPYGGVSWNPSASTGFTFSLSKGYRPPSVRELYLFPPANEQLVPERMVNVEAGWSQRWLDGKMSTELTLFRSSGENLIVLVPPAAPPPPRYQNSGQFSNVGLESVLNYAPVSGLRLHANYTYIHMENPLPATPAHQLFTSARYRTGKWSLMAKLQGIFQLYNQSSGGISVIEDNYQLLGARVGYRVAPFLDLFLSANNLLDQQYQINEGYPMPGVSVLGGFQARLSGRTLKRQN